MRQLAFLFLFILPFYGQAQDVKQTLQFGTKQYEAGNFAGAVKALQRAMYFGDEEIKEKGAYMLAESFFQTGDLERARQYFAFAKNIGTGDSLRQEARYREAGILILQYDFGGALSRLLAFSDSTSKGSRKDFFLAVSYFGLQRYEDSEKHFRACLKEETGEEDLAKIFKKVRRTAKKKPRTAKLLSYFTPGLGQFYAGDIKNGLNSFLLVGGLAAGGVYLGITYGILDAILIIAPWFYRYYRGGANRAEVIARDRLAEKQSQNYRKILELIGEQP